MRKNSIGALLMLQAVGSFAMNEIVSCDFFNQGAMRFQQTLNAAVKNAVDGKSTPNNVVAVASKTYQDHLAMFRERINQGFFDQIQSQELEQRQQTQNLIDAQDRRVENLKSRLRAVSKRDFSKKAEYREAEKNVRTAKEEAEESAVPELVTGKHIDRTMGRFTKQLNEIKEQIQHGQRTLGSAFERVQEKYNDNIELLVDRLEDRYEDLVTSINEQHEREREQLTKAYQQQKTLLKGMLKDAEDRNKKLEMERIRQEQQAQEKRQALEKAKRRERRRMEKKAAERERKLEKERELCILVNRVFRANPSLTPEKMVMRSEDIRRKKGIENRRKLVSEAYDKFAAFSDLYGRDDLGITAVRQDLRDVRKYLRDTEITAQIPQAPQLLGNVFQENQSRLVSASDVNFLESKYRIPVAPGGFRSLFFRDRGLRVMLGGYENTYNHYKDIENAERMRVYNEAKAVYEDDVYRARRIPFPSEAFDCLADQFNAFVNVL